MNTEKRYFRLPKRNLPVIGEADVIVVGASLGGISAAIRAAKEGAKVFVVGYMPYPGGRICADTTSIFSSMNARIVPILFLTPYFLKIL
jgi:phytoene dehydrogenase-like protein